MGLAIGFFLIFIKARLDGIENTSGLKDFPIDPHLPIKDAISETMDIIRSNPEFQKLQDKQGCFIARWRAVEHEISVWDQSDTHPDHEWFEKLRKEYFIEKDDHGSVAESPTSSE